MLDRPCLLLVCRVVYCDTIVLKCIDVNAKLCLSTERARNARYDATCLLCSGIGDAVVFGCLRASWVKDGKWNNALLRIPKLLDSSGCVIPGKDCVPSVILMMCVESQYF